MAGGVGPGLTHIQLTIGRSGIGDQREVADEWVRNQHACERLVAGVADSDGVVDDFTSSVGGAAIDRSVLDDVQAWGLFHGHRSIVGIRAGLLRVGSGQVDDRSTGVDLGLRDDVAGGVGPGLTHIQLTIGRSGIGDQREVADEWVRNQHACERLVAGVADSDGVVDDFTSSVGGATCDRSIFDDVQAGRLLHSDRSVIGIRTCLLRVGSCQVDDRSTGVDLGLRDNVAGGVEPGLAHIQLVISRGSVSHQREVVDERVGDSDTCERLVAGVLHADGVVDDFTCHVGRATSNRGIFDDVQRRHQLLVAKIHAHDFGLHGRDDNAFGVDGGLHPASLLNLTYHIGVVVRIRCVCVRCDGEAVASISVC